MRSTDFIKELKIDNTAGLGAVPYNTDVDYFGIKVMMRPSMFLKLSNHLDATDPNERPNIDYIKSQLDQQGIGAPFLQVKIPREWEDGDFSQPAKIAAHEGRHRMVAILEQEGNIPVEVHIFPGSGLRKRHILPTWIQRLNQNIINEPGWVVNGPIFEINK